MAVAPKDDRPLETHPHSAGGEAPAPGPSVPWSRELEPAPAAPAPIPLRPDPLVGQSVGGFVIEQPLGEGGMGLVFQARHPILNRRFAVKVLRPEAAANAWVAKSFLREAQVLSSLKHPHIVDIVDFGTLEGQRQYMVMEFLEGKTLAHELAEKGRLPCLRALELAEQILDALAAAHSVDVIHRDLKPGNVLLARVSGGSEVVKLLDFGLSKQTPVALAAGEAEGAEGRSVMAGTPEYVAPEQARGEPACKQSDLYSFGVMLFELLTGALPFASGPKRQNRTVWLLNMHAHAPAPRITPLPGGHPFPPELENLVAALLAKLPQQRPQSAAEVRTKVREILAALRRGQPDAPGPLAEQAAAAQRADTISLELTVPPARRALPYALGALALLLGTVALWPGETAAPAPPVAGPAPAGPARGETVVTTRLWAPPPAPAPEAPAAPAEEALAPLPVEARATARPKKPAAARPPLEECDPSPKWRASAQARLQEIQQLAAGATDARAWSTFEAAEPELARAIAGADSPARCGEVEQRIRTLARALSAGGKR